MKRGGSKVAWLVALSLVASVPALAKPIYITVPRSYGSQGRNAT